MRHNKYKLKLKYTNTGGTVFEHDVLYIPADFDGMKISSTTNFKPPISVDYKYSLNTIRFIKDDLDWIMNCINELGVNTKIYLFVYDINDIHLGEFKLDIENMELVPGEYIELGISEANSRINLWNKIKNQTFDIKINRITEKQDFSNNYVNNIKYIENNYTTSSPLQINLPHQYNFTAGTEQASFIYIDKYNKLTDSDIAIPITNQSSEGKDFMNTSHQVFNDEYCMSRHIVDFDLENIPNGLKFEYVVNSFESIYHGKYVENAFVTTTWWTNAMDKYKRSFRMCDTWWIEAVKKVTKERYIVGIQKYADTYKIVPTADWVDGEPGVGKEFYFKFSKPTGYSRKHNIPKNIFNNIKDLIDATTGDLKSTDIDHFEVCFGYAIYNISPYYDRDIPDDVQASYKVPGLQPKSYVLNNWPFTWVAQLGTEINTPITSVDIKAKGSEPIGKDFQVLYREIQSMMNEIMGGAGIFIIEDKWKKCGITSLACASSSEDKDSESLQKLPIVPAKLIDDFCKYTGTSLWFDHQYNCWRVSDFWSSRTTWEPYEDVKEASERFDTDLIYDGVKIGQKLNSNNDTLFPYIEYLQEYEWKVDKGPGSGQVLDITTKYLLTNFWDLVKAKDVFEERTDDKNNQLYLLEIYSGAYKPPLRGLNKYVNFENPYGNSGITFDVKMFNLGFSPKRVMNRNIKLISSLFCLSQGEQYYLDNISAEGNSFVFESKADDEVSIIKEGQRVRLLWTNTVFRNWVHKCKVLSSGFQYVGGKLMKIADNKYILITEYNTTSNNLDEIEVTGLLVSQPNNYTPNIYNI